MSCFRLNPAWVHESGGRPIFERPTDDKIDPYTEIRLPCGGCIGCRRDVKNEWRIRLEHEQLTTEMRGETALFLTFTYDEENCPEMLIHRDMQLFIKKYRKKTGFKIRYFLCGEYGTQKNRPHFHMILFGPWIEDLTKTVFRRQHGKPGYWYYESDLLNKTWGKGFVQAALATKETMEYVAGYMLKEQALTPQNIIDFDTGEIIQAKPYITSSKRPAIGYEWFTRYWTDCYPSDFLIFDGKKQPVPRYYFKKLEEIDPDMYEEVKRRRFEKAIATEDYWEEREPERLKERERIYKKTKKAFSKGTTL